MARTSFENPLIKRYATSEIVELFSPQRKFETWRRLWVALAEAEQGLGITEVTQELIDEMRAHVSDINYDVADARERIVRHDVMAHIYAYGEQCPNAKKIIHLGATSSYVQDNTEVIIMREALLVIRAKLITVIRSLRNFVDRWKSTACLAFTHYQSAQPTTVGRRACMWIQDLLMDLEELDHILERQVSFHGCKGATGTAASFLQLFDGDHGKCLQLERIIAEKMGFSSIFPVTGQTYPRKLDALAANVLSLICQGASKFANDVRLLMHDKELEEPRAETQVGSSAMPYKRNPMLCERMCSLGRFVICSCVGPALTASVQWLERTLDDSAFKRFGLPEAFMATDGVLRLYIQIAQGLVVYPHVVERNLAADLPFLATEGALMQAVKNGGNRQELHERLRQLTSRAEMNAREGKEAHLVEEVVGDPAFQITAEGMAALMEPSQYTGRAEQQAVEFLAEVVDPLLARNADNVAVTVSV